MNFLRKLGAHLQEFMSGDDNENDTGSWILTMSDLMTLLLVFFILLYSMSEIDLKKYEALADSLREAHHKIIPKKKEGEIIEEKKLEEIQAQNITSINDILNNKLAEILKAINRFIYQNNLQTKIIAFIDDRGVVIKISDDILFNQGQADLSARSRLLLNYIIELLRTFPYPIRVEGHTDNAPIHTEKFPSNWELSTFRATNVIRYFIQRGIAPSLFSAEGFGEYRPIANNTTDSGRGKNRRVEIVYKKTGILKALQENSED